MASERPARVMSRGVRMQAVRRGLAKRKARLAKSMAHCGDPRAADRARWDEIRAEIAAFEFALAELAAGRDPPPSPLTGVRVAALPDRIGPKNLGRTAGGEDGAEA